MKKGTVHFTADSLNELSTQINRIISLGESTDGMKIISINYQIHEGKHLALALFDFQS